jgi:hypothetical protein
MRNYRVGGAHQEYEHRYTPPVFCKRMDLRTLRASRVIGGRDVRAMLRIFEASLDLHRQKSL